ncbi:MAG: TRAP transporter substrate-binding protein [Syntrophobacter sp.]
MGKGFVNLLLLVLACLLCIPDASALTLRSADVHSEDYPTVQAVRYMGQLLNERSGGRISLEVLHSGQLGEEKELLEQCRAGGLDMMRTNLAPLSDTVPEIVVPALPYLFRSEEHLHKVLDGPIGREILVALESSDLIGLAFYDSGARSFYNTRKPLRSVEDFKGLRLRVQQSDIFKSLVESLGAVAVPLPFGEVHNALRTGFIDGAENNWPSYESTGHFKEAKYYTVDGHSMTPEVLVFSRKVWADLSGEDKKLILKAAEDSVPYMRSLWREREAQARRAMEQAGVEVVDIADRDPFIRAVKPVYDRYMSMEKVPDLIRRIQNTQ